jgi:hypothetical protein
MEPIDITKKIEAYLTNTLTSEEAQAFEKEIKANPSLQKEVALQQSIQEAAKRASMRTEIKKVAKSYHLYKNIATVGIVVAVLGLASVLGYFLLKKGTNTTEKVEKINPTLLNQLASNAPIEHLKSDFFTWNGSDSVLISKNGVLLSIPKDALLLDGNPYNEQAIIQWQEAIDAPTIMKSGLSTTSNGKLLETQGMFGIEVYTKDGRKLTVNPKVGIYVQVPVDQYKKGMMLFKGEKDKTGMINWVNPTPLQKIPVPLDMKDLNFYPKGYEDTLDKLKLPRGRKYRDSLYASLSIIEPMLVLGDLQSGEKLFESNCKMCHAPHEDYTGPKLFQVRDKWEKNKASKALYTWVQNWQKAAWQSKYAQKASEWSPSTCGSDLIKKLNESEILNIFDYIDSRPNSTYIPPSIVLAFWNKKFNNTNLSTREFETRMKEIHPTCKAEVLALYVNNLNKSIAEIDAQVAKMGYSAFEEFALENVGAVNPNNPHVKGLLEFYEKTAKAIAEQAQELQAIELEKEKKMDKAIAKDRNQEAIRSTKREAQALKEEYELNLANVGKQLGKTLGFMIHGGGTVYNIDKYVMDATIARKSTVITDPETGKTAKITYNDFSFHVKDAKKYPKLFAYLFPSKLNSYQRINGTAENFDYPLNDDMVYHLAIVGINEDGFFFYEQKNIKEGKLGTIALEKMSEKELDKRIADLNESRGIVKPMKINDELGWLVKEQKYYVETKRRMEHDGFVWRMKKVVFPCYREVEENEFGETEEEPLK